MLYTPPDLDGSPGSPHTGSHDDADEQFAFDPLVGGCYGSQTKDASLERSMGSLQVRDRETSHSQLAVVEVAKQVVEMKRLEASTAVELERLKQSGATERTRLLEEGRTQRSACVAAVMKRVMEEHHQTERQKIESTAQVQQATIAARVSEAEAQANTPARPMSHWLLLWLCLGQSRRVRKVGFPVLRVAGFLLVLRGIWSSGFKSTPVTLLQRAWRAVSTSLQQQLRDQLQPLQLSERDRLPELPELPSLASASNASSTTSGHNLNTFHKELEDLGLAGYLEDLLNLGYDGETLRDLKNGAEVQEMLSAINCRPEHRAVFLKALQRWQ